MMFELFLTEIKKNIIVICKWSDQKKIIFNKEIKLEEIKENILKKLKIFKNFKCLFKNKIRR